MTTRMDFYHLQKWPLETALPKLLERVSQAGLRAVVMAGSEARVAALSDLLWAYRDDAWLPHGSARDGFAEDQPAWLTTAEETPNGATVLVLTDGVGHSAPARFDRCLDLFDGNDAQALQAARSRWKAAREAGFEMHYWQQTDQGGWVEKATG